MRLVRDIMLPLDEYAIVGDDATIEEALTALEAAQANIPANRHPHRAVLVRDEQGCIIGKVDHLAFLRALLPDVSHVAVEPFLERAGVSDSMRETSMATLEWLAGDMVDICARARSQKVGDVCSPAFGDIEESASLIDAVKVFAHTRALSLLVRRGQATFGILRLADLFDELARQVRDDTCGEE